MTVGTTTTSTPVQQFMLPPTTTNHAAQHPSLLACLSGRPQPHWIPPAEMEERLEKDSSLLKKEERKVWSAGIKAAP